MLTILSGSVSLHAQRTIGDYTNLNLNAVMDFGYNGGFGDSLSSQHGINAGGQATLNGSYYNPKFLSFIVQPYYERSQSNSESASVTSSSGVNASAQIFRGSHFPGGIAFSKTYNASGTYGIPGVEGLTTHGDGQSLSVNWSALFPNRPTLTATYTLAGATSDIFGSNLTTDTHTRTLDLRSTYSLAGFHLNAYFTRLGSNGSWPDIFTQQEHSNSNVSDNIGAYAAHTLPMKGSFTGGWNWSNYNSEFENERTSGSTNNLNATFLFNPLDKLSVYSTTNYIGNVAGAINRDLIQAGGLPLASPENGSRSLVFNNGANYQLLRNLGIQANITQQEQWFSDGTNYSATRFTGSINYGYAKRLFGLFALTLGVIDVATEQGNTGASMVATVTMDKRFGRWEVGSDFNYNQAVETYYANYTTSSYSYGANARRKFGNRTYWIGTFRGYRSGFVRYEGSGSQAENVSTSLFWRLFSVNANYSQSHGTSVYTPNGLVPLPPNVPPAVTDNNLVLYHGKGFGFGFSLNAIRNLTATANYFKTISDTASPLNTLNNRDNQFNFILRYPFRKMFFNAGYTHLYQSISNAGSPVSVNTYYVGISRWFNFF